MMESNRKHIRSVRLSIVLPIAALALLATAVLFLLFHSPTSKDVLGLGLAICIGGVGLAVAVVFARRSERERKRVWDDMEGLMAQLERQRSQYRSLVDNVGFGVVRVDTELKVLAANAIFQDWFPFIIPGTGQRSVEIFGIGPGDPVPEDCPVLSTLADGRTHEVHQEVLVKGVMHHLRIVSSPVTGSDNTISSVIITLEDFTDHIAKDRELEAAEAKYRGIFENAAEGIYQTSVSGTVFSTNPALARILGYDSPQAFMDAVNQQGATVYVEPERRKEFLEILMRDGAVHDFESEMYTTDGGTIWASENALAVRDESGEITHIDGILLDITRRKRMETELRRQQIFFQELFESSPLAIILTSERGDIIMANHGFDELFGHVPGAVVGRRARDVVVPEAKLGESASMLRATDQGKTVSKETVRAHADGRMIPVQVIGYPVTIDDATAGAYYIYQDITERKEFERQLSHQAFHDALTSLPNRTLYMERLGRATQRGRRRENYRFAAMMIDLDRFKRVNDTLGHLVGDQLLVGVALRILSCIRTVDTVARLGGDEFAILLEEFEHSREVIQVANRIGTMLAEPFHIDGHEVMTGASIGIVLNTEAYERAEDILRDADIAMYQSKEKGKRRLVFNQRMHEVVLEETRMEEDLRAALEQDQLILHYQPIVNVETQALQGFEALVRWEHPTRGMLQPLEFIPLAEETGLIVPLGQWVIREACEQMAGWCAKEDDRCSPGVHMSVNISARQFVQPDLVEFIERELNRWSLDPARLKLEITETVLMDEAQQAKHKLDRLKELGVQIMVDDFGTGYSSLSYLQQFPVDYLKIDKTFISGEGSESENREIVNTIIMLARNLGLKVVAEGVEEPEHLAMLRDLNCDDAQGFMFSRPVAKAEAADILEQFLMALRASATK